MKKDLKLVLGVDQTGAVQGKGVRAKALPAVLAVREGKQWRVLTQIKRNPLILRSFDPDSIQELLKALGFVSPLESLVCAIDCVLGLPERTGAGNTKGSASLWKRFYEASEFSFQKKIYGRGVAESFFSQFLPESPKKIPRRFCEEVSGSNSVFHSRPYQKNIQTGTFRIWKELGKKKRPWARIWPYDYLLEPEKQSGPWLFEGYPSLLWREVFGAKSRKPYQLKELTQKLGLKVSLDSWKHLPTAPDHADAFVLALGAIVLERAQRLWEPSPSFLKEPRIPQEGWILGLKHPRDI